MTHPIFLEIPYSDPVNLFAPLAHDKGALFFDSVPAGDLEWPKGTGQYSFFATDPVYTLSSKNGDIDFQGDGVRGDPFSILQQSLKNFSIDHLPDLPPWQGGVGGFFSYDLCHHLEKLPKAKIDDMNFPDLMLGYYDVVVAFDHIQQKAWIISTGYPEMDPARRLARAQQRLGVLHSRLRPKKVLDHGPVLSNLSCNFEQESYQKIIQKGIDYIYDGDIFQVNLSRRLKGKLPDGCDLFRLYCRLRALNPAPFSAYYNCDPVYILSSSPERFLSLQGQHIETRPIKGTARRPANPSENRADDQHCLDVLRHSAKDQSENIMIVDLLRNDLSRVCLPHTVKTPALLEIETYATVHHLVSTVTGTLRPDCDAIDLLRATFPGGSITGAPKIRAMEIIAELEPTARGPYCGAIGYIGFDGFMDTNIAIRTIAVNGRDVCFQTGGGIVADSDPLAEYEETITKAAALSRVLCGV
ncbi:MAG: aminodeoxychorismate synthase component I [Alphaproteobacteria bacterium]|nr:aminodeoxychorismate synthase component I [Alphaproteobacteria bacterium]